MKYRVAVVDTNGQPVSDETGNTLNTIQELLYTLERLDAREDFAYNITVELAPENNEDIIELQERF